MVRQLSLKVFPKLLQIVLVHVGDGPVIEIRIKPMHKMVALTVYRVSGRCRAWSLGPNKQINEMLAPLVDQCGDRSVVEIIQATAQQRKAFATKIDNRRRKIELGIQPRFYRVLIRRRNVGKMICHKRSDMTGDKLRSEELIVARAWKPREANKRGQEDGSSQGEPAPVRSEIPN